MKKPIKKAKDNVRKSPTALELYRWYESHPEVADMGRVRRQKLLQKYMLYPTESVSNRATNVFRLLRFVKSAELKEKILSSNFNYILCFLQLLRYDDFEQLIRNFYEEQAIKVEIWGETSYRIKRKAREYVLGILKIRGDSEINICLTHKAILGAIMEDRSLLSLSKEAFFSRFKLDMHNKQDIALVYKLTSAARVLYKIKDLKLRKRLQVYSLHSLMSLSALSKRHDAETLARGMLSLPVANVNAVVAYVKELQSKDNETVSSASVPVPEAVREPATMVEITSDPAPTQAPVLEGKRPSFVRRMLDTISNIFVGER